MTEREAEQPISWQVGRSTVPTRPAFSSSLAPEERIERPKRLRWAVAAYGVGALATLAFTGFGALILDDVRSAITTALPDDLSTEYSAESIERAATALIAAVGAILVLLLIFQGLSLRAFLSRRSTTGRTVYCVTAICMMPVLVLGVMLAAYETSVASAAVTAIALTASVTLALSSRVTRWLKQSEERRTIPIGTPEEP